MGVNGYKVRVFPSVVKHANRGFELLLREFQAHVPGVGGVQRYRSATARMMGLRANPLPAVPLHDQLRTAYRAVASLGPNYDHAHQPIPAWADTWFANCARGQDMTRVYGTVGGEPGAAPQ